MRIIHPSGECYDLPSETTLEFTRYNPFFNDLGEMSQPIRLPLTPRNKRLLGFPHRMDRRARPEDIDVIIDLGFASVPARQVIHTVDAQSADTTFYLNDGGLYARIAETPLKDVFSAEIIEFVSVTAAVEFCENMNLGFSGSAPDSRFAIFEVAIDGAEDGLYRILNEAQSTTSKKYKGRNARTETVGDKVVTYPQGYGITPFARVGYVIRKICDYFGYTADLGMFDKAPFADMVLINRNMDTLIDGKIHVSTLMPDVTVKQFFTAMRSRFCMEFYPDEITRTLSVHFFRDIPSKTPIDLTAKMAGYPETEYPDFSRISLISDPIVEKDESYQSITELLESHPGIYRAHLYPNGYAKLPGINRPFFYHPLTQKVYQAAVRGMSVMFVERGTFADSYVLPVELEETQITIEGKIPSTMTEYKPGVELYDAMLYVGAGRCVKSVIVYSDDTSDSDTSGEELPVMTAFAGQFNKGTVGDICRHSDTPTGYSLVPNGENGLFARFWTYYAHLHQNALAKLTVNLRLSMKDKVSLSAMEKVILNNQEYLIDSIRYSLDSDSASEVTLYSLAEYAPAIPVPVQSLSDYPAYEWVMKVSYNIPGYNISELVFAEWTGTIETLYFDTATEDDYNNYRDGSTNYAQQRTYSGKWYRSIAGPNSDRISGTATIGYQVKKA